jgi:hypothetical protein
MSDTAAALDPAGERPNDELREKSVLTIRTVNPGPIACRPRVREPAADFWHHTGTHIDGKFGYS